MNGWIMKLFGENTLFTVRCEFLGSPKSCITRFYEILYLNRDTPKRLQNIFFSV